MQILIADADPASVFATRRLLTREFGCAAVEVDNGLDALHELSHRTYAALLLSCDLPGIGALEIIESLQACPETKSLPVIALAAERTEGLIRELARHGVRHCLAKPLDLGHARKRLQRVLEGQHARKARIARRSAAGVEVPDGATVVIADADPDFRHFFASLLAKRFRVLSASSGAEALKVVSTGQPAVLCLGDHLGPLGRRMLVQKLHQARSVSLPLLLAITGRANVDVLAGSGLFDGVLTRTFVPSRFQEQFETFVSRPSSLQRVLERAPGLRGAMLSATEQACGMLMNLELEAAPTGGVALGDGFSAVVQMAVRIDDEVVGMRCAVSAPVAGASRLGARMLGAAAEELTDADLVSVIGELANIITGRIQNALQERTLPTRCGLPKLSDGRVALVTGQPRAIETHFRFPDGNSAVWVDLVGVESADAALAQTLPPAASSSAVGLL